MTILVEAQGTRSSCHSGHELHLLVVSLGALLFFWLQLLPSSLSMLCSLPRSFRSFLQKCRGQLRSYEPLEVSVERHVETSPVVEHCQAPYPGQCIIEYGGGHGEGPTPISSPRWWKRHRIGIWHHETGRLTITVWKRQRVCMVALQNLQIAQVLTSSHKTFLQRKNKTSKRVR